MTLLILLALSAEIAAAFVATAYMVKVLAPERGKSLFLDRLLARNVRVTLSGGVIGSVVVYSLLRFTFPELGLGPIVSPLFALLVGGPVAFMLWGPISDALTVHRERQP